MKKMICFVLTLCLLISTTVPAFAEERVASSGYVNTSATLNLTNKQAEEYMKYQADISASKSSLAVVNDGENVSLDYLLQHSEKIENCKIGDTECVVYNPELFNAIFPYSEEIRDVSTLDDVLYVSYLTTDGKEVIISYIDSEFNDMCIYDEQTDEAVFISTTEKCKFTGFRRGTHYQMSEETKSLIDSYLENGDIEGLAQVENINVIDLGDGNYYIEEIVPGVDIVVNELSAVNFSDTASLNSIGTKSNNTGVKGFRSTSELIADLKSDFPYLNTSSFFSRNCTALGKNVDVKVETYRNNYVKLSADWRNFGIGTALSLIASFLTIDVPMVATILSTMSIAVSAESTIKSAVTLYSTAEYTFSGRLVGRVYDSTKYDDYVYVIEHTDEGRFAGGYDANDLWHWIIVERNSALDMDKGTAATNAMTDYNWDIALNGICSAFTPYGFV